jgi:hypothetical protein
MVRPHIDDHGKERTVAEMQYQQIGGYPALIDYMRAVFTRTEAWLEQLALSELERVVIPRPFPPHLAGTFSARVVGEKGITVLDGIEYQRRRWSKHMVINTEAFSGKPVRQ